MKYAYAIAALVAVVSAQTRADIPSCALACLDDAILKNTRCSITDYSCVCHQDNFSKIQGAPLGCILKGCGTDTALTKYLPAVQALCAAQGGSPSKQSKSGGHI